MSMPKYLFINKDASSNSLTQSSRHQRSAIQKHVQRRLVRTALLSVQESTTYTIATQDLVDDKALYSPSIRALSCKLDAFRSASIYIDRTVRVLLDYYIFYYHPMIWNYEPFASPPLPESIQNAITLSVRTALQDALAMNCLLSSSASRMINVDGFSFPGSPSREHFYMQQALMLMRQRIIETNVEQTEAIDHLVECMMFLCSAEVFRGNYEAARPHLKGAIKSLESEGGAASIRDTHMHAPLIQADLAISCINQEPCLFPCDFYDPGPASTLALKGEEFHSSDGDVLGSKLLNKGPDILPLNMKTLIWAIVDVYVTRRGLQTATMDSARAFQTTYWVQKRNMAIRNRLIAISTSDRRVQALRTALIMWTLLSMNRTDRLKTVKGLAPKLHSILDGITTAEWKDNYYHEDVKLWILLLGHSCAEEGTDTDWWFAEQVRWVLKENPTICSKRTTEDLAQILVDFQRGFFYDDVVQNCRTQKLAAWLVSGEDTVSI